MARDADTSDRYASAKATLRENVKWLAASFAGMAALLLAGTPFTGFGSLPFGSARFIAAAIGLLAAAFFAFVVWKLLLDIMRPDATYTNCFRDGVNPEEDKNLTHAEQAEYRDLKDEFNKQKSALLPDGTDTFDKLEQAVKDTWDDYQADVKNSGLRDRWLDVDGNLRVVEDWAAYTRLHQRFTRGITKAQWFAIPLLIALAVFAYAANPAKPESDTGDQRPLIIDQSTRMHGQESASLPLDPVLFDLGKSKLTAQGIAAVGRARDALRRSPDASLLLLAHTDTLGGAAINTSLAAARANVVRKSLIEEGGVAASRIFIAALPETNLPVVTAQDSPQAENRAVRFVLVRAPAQ